MLRVLLSILLLLPLKSKADEACYRAVKSLVFLSQLDRRVQEAGFWEADAISRVCGPTCLVNLLSLTGGIKPATTQDLIPELAEAVSVTRAAFRELRIHGDPILGTNTRILTVALKKLAKAKGLKAKIRPRWVYDLHEEVYSDIGVNDLVSESFGKRFSVVRIVGGESLLEAIGLPTVSHSVLAVGFDKIKNALIIHDPFFSNVPLLAHVKSIQIFGRKTLILDFEKPPLFFPQPKVFIIGSSIQVDLKSSD